MFEPIDPPVPVPRGGWPRVCLRLELTEPLSRELALYELACAARRFRMGVLAVVDHVELFAFPHQSIDELARSFARQRRMQLKPVQMEVAPAAEPAHPRLAEAG